MTVEAMLRAAAELQAFEEAERAVDQVHEAFERAAGRYILPDENLDAVLAEIARRGQV